MKRKMINFRAFLVVSSAVTAAVLCAYLYALSSTAGIVLCIVFAASGAACSVVSIILCVKSRIKLRFPITFCLALCMFISAFSFGATYANEREAEKAYAGLSPVSGRVCAVNTRSGAYSVDIEDPIIDGKSVDGIMRVTISASDGNIADLVSCGDVLTFDGYVKVLPLTDGGVIDGFSYRSDIRYRTTVGSDGITVEFGEPNFFEKITEGLRTLYVENMGDVGGNIAYSMLTGDKHALDHGVSEYFSAAGLGHIMAVSGLHIGFLIMILSFVLSRINRKVRFGIIALFLVAYMILADFSPSVVRAVIMAFVSGIAILTGSRRDLLSSLLCAYSIILCVRPFYLFETGFSLSFGAIFGIALFSGTFCRFLQKHGAPYKLANAVASAVAVSIGVAPSTAAFFGTVDPMIWLTNTVVIPYTSVVFTFLVCLTPIALIPHCGQILVVCKYLFTALDAIAYGASALSVFTFRMSAAGAVRLCYPVMFFMSEFAMLGRVKRTVVIYSVAIIAFIFVVCSL